MTYVCRDVLIGSGYTEIASWCSRDCVSNQAPRDQGTVETRDRRARCAPQTQGLRPRAKGRRRAAEDSRPSRSGSGEAARAVAHADQHRGRHQVCASGCCEHVSQSVWQFGSWAVGEATRRCRMQTPCCWTRVKTRPSASRGNCMVQAERNPPRGSTVVQVCVTPPRHTPQGPCFIESVQESM